MLRNNGRDNFGLITDDIEGRLPSEEYIAMTGDFAKGPERQSDYLDINDDVFEIASLKASMKRGLNAATYAEVADERNIPATCTHGMEENLYVERECQRKSNNMKKGKKRCVYAVTTLSRESKPRAINKSFSTKQIHRQDLYSYAAPHLPTIKKSQSLDVLPGSASMQTLSAKASVSSIAESSSEIYLTPTKGAQSAIRSGTDSELTVGKGWNELVKDEGNSDGLDQSCQLSPRQLRGNAIYRIYQKVLPFKRSPEFDYRIF